MLTGLVKCAPNTVPPGLKNQGARALVGAELISWRGAVA